MSTVSDKILKLSEELGPLKDALKAKMAEAEEVQKKLEADEDDETLPDVLVTLSQDIDEARAAVEKKEKERDALRKFEESVGAKKAVAAVETGPGVIKKRLRSDDEKPGAIFAKLMLAEAHAKIKSAPRAAVVEGLYGDDERTKAAFNWLTKTEVLSADTTTSGWAAELVRTEMRGFLDTLKTRSVGAAIATRSMLLDFAGAHAVTVPRRNPMTGTMTEPAWVGEGGVIPLQQFSFGSTTLNRYKLASIVPLTMELVEQSVPQAEQIMIDAMQEAYTIMLDNAILSNAAAVAGVRPAGLLQGVTVNSGDATGGYESVIADMKTLMAALSQARLGVRPLLILNDQDYIAASMLTNPLGQMPFQSELAGGRLMGAEVIASQNATKGTAIMIDAAAIATAFDGPQVRISQEATLTMANADGTAPSQAADAAGALGTAGQVPPDEGGHVSDAGAGATGPAAFQGLQAMSMFQTYSEAIRGVWPTSWAIMRPGAVVALDSLSWG